MKSIVEDFSDISCRLREIEREKDGSSVRVVREIVFSAADTETEFTIIPLYEFSFVAEGG